MPNPFTNRRCGPVVLLIALIAAGPLGCASKQVTHMPPIREGAPYSRAVRVGDTLYLAGDGAPHDDPVQEAHNLMRSVRATLALNGMTLDDLVYVTVYCSDVSLYDTFNDVYAGYFADRDRMPARAFVGSGELLFGIRYELQGIAVAP